MTDPRDDDLFGDDTPPTIPRAARPQPQDSGGLHEQDDEIAHALFDEPDDQAGDEPSDADLPSTVASTGQSDGDDFGDFDSATPAAAAAPRRPGGTLAFAALTAIGLAALTGVGLEFHYTPSPDLAHASLLSLENDQPYGALLRSVHWVSANASIALLLAVLVGAFVTGDYRGRSYAWWTGVLTFLVAVGFGITGELLPWTEQGVFATEVRAGIAGMSPEIGEQLRTRLIGGDVVAGPTLTRFHALHVAVLPLALILLLLLHAAARRRIHQGPTPRVTLLQAGAGLLTAAAIGYGAWILRAPQGAVYVAGDVGYQPWPEWHFLWLNKLLHDLPDQGVLVAIYLPGALLLVAMLLPLFDRAHGRRFAHPAVLIPGLLVLIGMGTLSGLHMGEKPENEPTLPYSLDLTPMERLGYQLVRRHDCLECHQYERDGVLYGNPEPEHEGTPFADFDAEMPLADYSNILKDPEAAPWFLEDMPAYDYVPEEQRRAIGAYLKRVAAGD